MKPTLTPDQVVAVMDHVAAAQVALSGKFDERINELKALQVDIAAKAAIIGSAEDAQKVRDEADAYRKSQEAAVVQMRADLDAEGKALDRREVALVDRETVVKKAEEELRAAQTDHRAKISEHVAKMKKQEELHIELDRREQGLRDRQDSLEKREIALNTKVSKLREASAAI